MKLSTAREEFLADCRLRGLSPATLDSYRSDLNLLVGLASVHAADNVISFTPGLVRRYFLALANKGLAAATLHRRRASISEFAKWCLLRRLVADHPMADTPKIKRPRRPPRPFASATRDKLAALHLAGVDALIRELLFGAGLRVTEACTLQVGDVDLGVDETRGSIRVHGKGDKIRVVPLTPELWHLLRDFMLAHTDVSRMTAYVLPRPDGRPWTRRMIERRTRAWGAALKLDEPVTPHRFRHTFGTRLLEERADLREIQELMGHADISTTAGYADVVPERLRSAVNRLSRRAPGEKVLREDSAPPCNAPTDDDATTRK